MSRKIKYVGPFLTVEAEGHTFTRHIFTDVADEAAEKLLASKLAGGVNAAFVEKQADPEPVAAEPAVVVAPAPKPARAR